MSISMHNLNGDCIGRLREGYTCYVENLEGIDVGSVSEKGSSRYVYDLRNKMMGSVDSSGSVCDPSGIPVGNVDRQGCVYIRSSTCSVYSSGIGKVDVIGRRALGAGAAWILLLHKEK